MHHTTGSLYFSDCVQAAGISHVFFVPVIFTPSLVALEKRGITPVTTHSEKSAAYMADGLCPRERQAGDLSCTDGRLGESGRRLARCLLGAVTGHRGHRREIAPGGNIGVSIKRLMTLRCMNLSPSSMFKSIRLSDWPTCCRKHFGAATSGCPRPVHLECAGMTGQAIDGEIEVARGFDDRFFQVPAFRSPANLHDVARVADLLQRSERPVIVAGGGVASSRAEAEVVALARKLSIPVATSLNAKGTIPENDPLSIGVVGLYSRECTNKIVCGADVVFYIGSATGSQVTNGWQVPRPGTSVIQLDIEADAAGRNYRNVASLCGDAKTVLQQLIEACSARKPDDWLSDCREQVQSWIAEVRPLVESENSPLRPERICQELSQVLPDDAILVSETGHAGILDCALCRIELAKPNIYTRRGLVGLGVSRLNGSQVCGRPDRPVICFSGDGGFYYHMSEMETAVRYGINVVIVINNNRSLNMEKELYADAYGETEQTRGLEMWRFQEMNFAKIAEAMGCFAVRAERPGEVGPAIEKALAAGRPAVVDVVSDINVLAPLGWAP